MFSKPKVDTTRLGWIVAATLSIGPALAATKPVDLDGQTANGAESACELNVLQTFPVKIENKITNKALGEAFTFSWPSAGPGGFSSSVTQGTTGGVGAKWIWTSNQTVYSYTGTNCLNDICFNQTEGSVPAPSSCSFACLADGATMSMAKGATAGNVVVNWAGGSGPFTVYRSTIKSGVAVPANAVTTTDLRSYTDTPPAGAVFYLVRGVDCATRKPCTSDTDCSAPGDGTCVSHGPFAVPGRSLLANEVTVSAASLTSSLITFFSPPKEVFSVTSSAGPGGSQQSVTNGSTSPVTVTTQEYPVGCCPANDDGDPQLRCGEACVDFLNDPENCGSCGNVCGDDTCCTGGVCASLCGEGQTLCDGQCADLANDSANCGACGNVCPDGSCCSDGACASVCGEGDTYCGNGECADLANDSANCGACGNACAADACCTDGVCVSVCGEGQVFCDGQCVDLSSDSDNCGACGNSCGGTGCCVDGSCTTGCEDGRTLCGDQCFDTQNDPENCGGCGIVCDSQSICSAGACQRCPGQGGARDACDNVCVNLRTDPYNCGSCGNSCQVGCPSNFHGVCSNGQSCSCVEGAPPPPPPSNIPEPTPAFCPNPDETDPIPGVCPNPDATTGSVPGVCPNPNPTDPVPAVCPDPGEPLPDGSVICEVNATSTLVPPGGSSTICNPGGILFKEVPTLIKACGDSLPGPDGTCGGGTTHVSTGTFMRLVPDTSKIVGDAYLTPYAVQVLDDTSGDGLLEPGETAKLLIKLINAGPVNVLQATATLLPISVDATDDGVSNPVAISVDVASSSYGTVQGTIPTGDCTPTLYPAPNSLLFQVTVPPEYPGDSSAPVKLRVVGLVEGEPFTMDVPLSLGIADRCIPAADTGDYDGIDGLLTPMAKLVPAGDPVPFPTKSFSAGNTRPLKLRLFCGQENLDDASVEPPQIIGLSEATRGPLDINLLNLNADSGTNPNDPFFRFNNALAVSGGPHWSYSVRTALLGTGTFTVTIRIAGRKEYVTGFVLE